MEENTVTRAIRLSLLKKSEAEQEQFHGEVERILSFIKDIQSVKTDTETERVGAVNIFRDDVANIPAGAFRENILKQAPMRYKNWFISKKIL